MEEKFKMEKNEKGFDFKSENNKTWNNLFSKGLKKTQIETIMNLVKVSNGRLEFETTLEELTENFYPNYLQIKKDDVKGSKLLRARVRCRLSYFVDCWPKKNENIYFEILSKKCAPVGCAAGHSIKNPNPDIITIRLHFLNILINENLSINHHCGKIFKRRQPNNLRKLISLVILNFERSMYESYAKKSEV